MSCRRRMGSLGLTLAMLLCFAAGTAQAGTWTNLWSTREQQAQHLLDSKNPAAAAPLFSDARRRAYAEMEAGQYAQAAKALQPFKDADSQYNRGNALAHSGQLREALSAYDAALRSAPGDKDVIRNRDLVRRALERQQQNQSGQQGGANGRSGSQGSKGGQSQGGNQSQGGGQPQPGSQSQAGNQSRAGGQSQPGNQSQAANQGHNGSQGQSGSQGGAQSQPGQGGSQNQPGAQSQPNNQSQAGNQSRAGDPSQPGNQSQAANQGHNGNQAQSGSQGGAQSQPNNQSQAARTQGGQNTPGQSQSNIPSQAATGSQTPAQAANQTPSGPGDNTSGEGALAPNGQQTNGSTGAAGLNAENAQQDANAALRYRQGQQGRAAPGTNPNDTRGATVLAPDGKTRSSADIPPPKPPSEQSLALDQWLRGIPDDSGELLRRKFLIEHMLKQQRDDQ
jgi:Ca-activated chloride channel homolog